MTILKRRTKTTRSSGFADRLNVDEEKWFRTGHAV